MDKNKFSEQFTILCEFFDKEPSKIYTEMYYKLLQDLTAQQLSAAVTEVLKTRKYTKMPLPAEIRESALGNVEIRAVLACDQILKAIETIGGYSSIVFEDNIINHLVAGVPGGWSKLCETTYQDWQFLRKDLIKRYIALTSRENELAEIESIAGRTEMVNDLNGNTHYSQELKKIDTSIIGILPEGRKKLAEGLDERKY